MPFKLNQHFVGILNSWIVLPTKYTKLNVQQIKKIFTYQFGCTWSVLIFVYYFFRKLDETKTHSSWQIGNWLFINALNVRTAIRYEKHTSYGIRYLTDCNILFLFIIIYHYYYLVILLPSLLSACHLYCIPIYFSA